MGILKRLFRTTDVNPKRDGGIRLDTGLPYWELEGPKTFETLLNALVGWLPQDSMLYFEDCCLDSELTEFMEKYAVTPTTQVALGTIWPRPRVWHVPAGEEQLTALATIMSHHANPELAIHFHVYRENLIIIEWHDAFLQPMLLNGNIPETRVKQLAGVFGKNFQLINPSPQKTPIGDA